MKEWVNMSITKPNTHHLISPDSALNLIYYCTKNYGKALKCGTRYIYQTLPKLLTLWLDAGAKYLSDNGTVLRMNKMVAQLSVAVPPYQFLTALPQLVSRICHPNQSVYDTLERIILSVLLAYPQQALWQLIAAYKSKNKVRSSRCQAIFMKAKVSCNNDLGNVIFSIPLNLSLFLSRAHIIRS